jgi:phosphoglycolate phosphatase
VKIYCPPRWEKIKMKFPIHTILFDFDYTLADSSRGVESCINYALRQLGFPPVSYQEVCKTIGSSLPETYAHLTGESASLSGKFQQLFIERAEEVMADRTVLFESTPVTIRSLRELGYTLGIVSTKFRYRIETILRREGLGDSFQVIVGGEDVAKHKPDPESLVIALDRLAASPGESIYVGDHVIDAIAASEVGIPFIAVLSGVTPREAFKECKVHWILRDVSGLPALLQR